MILFCNLFIEYTRTEWSVPILILYSIRLLVYVVCHLQFQMKGLDFILLFFDRIYTLIDSVKQPAAA